MEGLVFRQATSMDFPSLARIISTTEAWTCYGIDYDQVLDLLGNMEDLIYVAEKENQTLGFITVRLNGVGNIGAYIRMVAVAEAFRSQGIGEKLVAFVENLAFRHIPNLFLICSVDNTRAQHFYERVGFENVGILPNLVISGHDEILCRKTAKTLREC